MRHLIFTLVLAPAAVVSPSAATSQSERPVIGYAYSIQIDGTSVLGASGNFVWEPGSGIVVEVTEGFADGSHGRSFDIQGKVIRDRDRSVVYDISVASVCAVAIGNLHLVCTQQTTARDTSFENAEIFWEWYDSRSNWLERQLEELIAAPFQDRLALSDLICQIPHPKVGMILADLASEAPADQSNAVQTAIDCWSETAELTGLKG